MAGVGHGAGRRSRTVLLAAAGLATVALASAAGGAASTGGQSPEPGAGQTPAPVPQPPAPKPAPQPEPQPATRYRIVGCRSRGPQAYLHGPRVREVAIGFDDGPAPDTREFVSMLERNRVRATFFMIGEHVASGYRGVLLRELRNGDVLGDHTYTHPDLVTAGGVRSQNCCGRSTRSAL